MAKRFTDTEKWKKESFGNLSLKMKLVWIYICDNCDHAGIWDANLKLLAFQIGEPVTKAELESAFGDKIVWLSPTKVFIQSFIEFQYGELNPSNRAHASVISKLKKEGVNKGLTRPLQGAKDKDKDKEQDKEQEKGECEGILDPNPEHARPHTPATLLFDRRSRFDLTALYNAYPRQQKKAKSLEALARIVDSQKTYNELQIAIRHYAQANADQEAMYILTLPNFLDEWREWANGPPAGFSPRERYRMQHVVPD